MAGGTPPRVPPRDRGGSGTEVADGEIGEWTGWRGRGTSGPPVSEYRELSDDRLVSCYRRNSKLLRRSGPDLQTIRVLCAVEECLRARDIDPDAVIDGLDT